MALSEGPALCDREGLSEPSQDHTRLRYLRYLWGFSRGLYLCGRGVVLLQVYVDENSKEE
jgi:hypothetical protein